MALAVLRRRHDPQRAELGVRVRSRLDVVRDNLGPNAWSRRMAELQRRFGITRSGWIALGAAVLLWLFARIVAGTAIYATAYGAGGLVLVGFALAPRRLGLRGERSGLRPRAQEGDRLDVEIRLWARRSVSAFIVEERVPEKLGVPVRVPVTRLPARAGVAYGYSLACSRRGSYHVGPLVAVAADPLGLYRRETVVAEPFELLVHPRVDLVSDRPLTRAYEDPPIRPPVSRPWPSGLEFYGMREYVPGDDLRRVVWRATARTGKIMVREAEQGITDHMTLILDTDRGAHSRDGEDLSESFETAVRVIASLGVRHLREGYEVRCETNGGPLTLPMRGVASQTMLLDSLARLTMHRDGLTKAFLRLLATANRDAHNVLVTPRLSTRDAALLKQMLDTGVSVLVVALQFDEEDNGTVAAAAGVGCQVTTVRPGDDLGTALRHGVGGGSRS